jgi:hypothetical protein
MMKKMMTKDIWELKPDYQSAMDIRGESTKICPCGSFVWKLLVTWSDEDDTIASYFTDMECAVCGTKATTPMEENL